MLSQHGLLYNSPDSFPYTFFPQYILAPVSVNRYFTSVSLPQNNSKPLFFKNNVPKEDPLRHWGKPPSQGSISMLSQHGLLYNSPDSFPYTFFPLYILAPVSVNRYFTSVSLPQNNSKPLFFKNNVPKEDPLRHWGIPPPQGSISMLSQHGLLYNSPDSFPYTFFPLYILSHVSINRYFTSVSLPQKNSKPLFFKNNVPKEDPLRHWGKPPSQGSISMLSQHGLLYNSPDSFPYTFFPLPLFLKKGAGGSAYLICEPKWKYLFENSLDPDQLPSKRRQLIRIHTAFNTVCQFIVTVIN